MLDANRYHPGKYYIDDFYLEYLAAKRGKKPDWPTDYSSLNERKPSPRQATFQNRRAAGGSTYGLLHVLRYDPQHLH